LVTPDPPSRSRLPEALRAALERGQIPGLDALRAFAVLLVIFYHHNYPVPGDLGVLAFFVLSGFLITWLLLKEHTKHGDISLRLFYIRRSLRIFPAFYTYWILVIGLLLAAGKPVAWPQAWASFFYVNNYYQAIYGHFSSVLSHTWSLGVEEQFYLLWPVALIAMLRRQADVARWLMAAIGVVWAWRAVLEFGIGIQEVWVYEAFDARADHLLMGCLLAVALYRGAAPRLFAWLCSSPMMPVFTLALLIGEVAWTHSRQGSGPGTASRSFEFALRPLLIAALMTQWMAFARSPGWHWLNWKWLVYLGRISYSTYLYQQITPALVKPLTSRLPMVPPIVITLPATILFASVSYFLIEKPFLGLKDRVGQRVPESPAPGAPPPPPPPPVAKPVSKTGLPWSG
jgi:peptidoglycan/LPS O-acetylase OafA/YrhL